MGSTITDFGSGRAYQGAAVLLFLGLVALILWTALPLTGGELVYALDDPAIHMEIARSILGGGYGVNPGEYASPSSSILYPILVAGTFALGLGVWGPLVLNLAAGALAAWLIAGFVWRRSAVTGFGAGMAWALLPFWIVFTYLAGLVFIGMEHGLHVLVSVAVVIGLAGLEKGGTTPLWLGTAIILAPLLRFEGFALAGLAVIALLLLGRGRAALWTALGLVVAVSAYAMVMVRLGLPVIPSSILAKSQITSSVLEGGGTLSRLAARVGKNVALFEGKVLLAGLALVLGALLAFARSRREILVGLVVLGAAGAHLVLGRLDVWSRYEAYAFALLFCGLIYLAGPAIARRRSAPVAIILVALLVMGSFNIAARLWLMPAAMNSIHSQQVQMGRFAREVFPEPVAINDLGYVTFRNDTYVLDLMGLASEPARAVRNRGFASDEIGQLATDHGVVYAMVYDEWLGRFLPGDWCRVAVLTSPHVTTAAPEVSFYAVDRTREADLRAAINTFASTLPPKTTVTEAASC